jgi:hypothetical protein
MTQHLRRITIQLNDGREIKSTFSASTAELWWWVVENVASNMDCDEDDVDCVDNDDHFDNITVKGEIVGHIDYGIRRDRSAAMLQAAE